MKLKDARFAITTRQRRFAHPLNYDPEMWPTVQQALHEVLKQGEKYSWMAAGPSDGTGVFYHLRYGARSEWCNWELPVPVAAGRFDLGLPVTLVPVRKGDYIKGGGPKREDGSDTFGQYLNGGCLVSDTIHFLAAHYVLGEGEKAGILPESIEKERKIGRLQREDFRKAYLAGAKMAFGTDGGVYPHGVNWKQFGTMVEWGMKPIDAFDFKTYPVNGFKADRTERTRLNGEYDNYRWYIDDAGGIPMVALAYTENLVHARALLGPLGKGAEPQPGRWRR